ncbi:hypothetical protein Emed_002134 [Eimeria media]
MPGDTPRAVAAAAAAVAVVVAAAAGGAAAAAAVAVVVVPLLQAALLGASCAAALSVGHPLDLSRTLLLTANDLWDSSSDFQILCAELRVRGHVLLHTSAYARSLSGLAGLYCGLPWGLISLIPYAGAAAFLHSPCLPLLTDLNRRLKGVQQNNAAAAVAQQQQQPSPNG